MPKKSDSLSLEDGEVSAKIEECLLNVKNDTSFMEGGPPADQFHKIHSLDDIGPFMTYVAQSLAGSKKQKKVEKYVQFLEQGIDKWKDVIKNFDPQKTTRPATNGTSASMQESDLDTTHTKTRKRSLEPNPPGQATKKPRNEDESTTNATAKSQKGKQATTTKKKKKAKRRASKDNQGSKVITFSENEKHEFAKRSKSEYLAMKEDILEGLSDKYKSQFGQVVFAKWQKMWRPVLIVSPFDVDPNSRMRQDWMTMYKNVSERRVARLRDPDPCSLSLSLVSSLSHLVYSVLFYLYTWIQRHEKDKRVDGICCIGTAAHRTLRLRTLKRATLYRTNRESREG